MVWHNFHTHAQRWNFAGVTVDERSLSPAEIGRICPRLCENSAFHLPRKSPSSPQGKLHDLGRLFFALAGPPLSKVTLY
jgi:hypothetical protein